MQGQETPPDEASPYLRNLDASDFQSMKNTASPDEFAEAASQSSNQGEGSGRLVSQKSGQRHSGLPGCLTVPQVLSTQLILPCRLL